MSGQGGEDRRSLTEDASHQVQFLPCLAALESSQDREEDEEEIEQHNRHPSEQLG
jgi:hypothetical protein